MHTGSLPRADQAGKVIGRAPLAAFLAILAVTLGALVVFGPQIHPALEAQRARIIDEENMTFCVRFGAGPETGQYAECAAALNEIRARHEERIAREAGRDVRSTSDPLHTPGDAADRPKARKKLNPTLRAAGAA
jgi:hypothetical protein